MTARPARDRLGRAVAFFVLATVLGACAGIFLSRAGFRSRSEARIVVFGTAAVCVAAGYFMAYRPGRVYDWLQERDKNENEEDLT